MAEQREQLKAQRVEIESLRGAAKHGRASADDSDDESTGDEHLTKKKKSSKHDSGALKTDALQAGKRFAVCNMLWIPPGAIQHLPLIADPPSDDEALDSADEQQMKASRIIFESLSAPLRPCVSTKWFRNRVSNIYIMHCLLTCLSIFAVSRRCQSHPLKSGPYPR